MEQWANSHAPRRGVVCACCDFQTCECAWRGNRLLDGYHGVLNPDVTRCITWGWGDRGVGPGWGIHYLSYCPHGFRRGSRSAGLVGGQDTQSRPTRTPSPAVAVAAVVGGSYGLTPRIYLGDDAESADHGNTGQTVKLLGIPEGQRYRFGVATSHGTRL